MESTELPENKTPEPPEAPEPPVSRVKIPIALSNIYENQFYWITLIFPESVNTDSIASQDSEILEVFDVEHLDRQTDDGIWAVHKRKRKVPGIVALVLC